MPTADGPRGHTGWVAQQPYYDKGTLFWVGFSCKGNHKQKKGAGYHWATKQGTRLGCLRTQRAPWASFIGDAFNPRAGAKSGACFLIPGGFKLALAEPLLLYRCPQSSTSAKLASDFDSSHPCRCMNDRICRAASPSIAEGISSCDS